jgi:hypothetical protein
VAPQAGGTLVKRANASSRSSWKCVLRTAGCGVRTVGGTSIRRCCAPAVRHCGEPFLG